MARLIATTVTTSRFLSTTLLVILDYIPGDQNQTMGWQQDGFSPHNSERVTHYLNNPFNENFIGNIRWPALLPDLSPVYFFAETFEQVV